MFGVEVWSVEYSPFGEEKKYRYVINKERNKTGQADVFSKDNFTYVAISTTDTDSSTQSVIQYYNQRSTDEKIFDEINSDFGWKNLPFSFSQENTVYTKLMAMCRNCYLTIMKKISQKGTFV